MTALLALLLAQSSAPPALPLPNWALGAFVRPALVNPIISPDPRSKFDCPLTPGVVAWEANDTFNPGAVVRDGKVNILYRAEDRSGVGIGSRTSRLGLAVSGDGLHVRRRPSPVFYPAHDGQEALEWPGGCEDPRVAVTEDGTYLLLYTQWNRKVARLAVATSRDLLHWTKYGPAFMSAYDGKFAEIWSKSASVVTQVVDGRQVIAKVNGKYFMYWGEQGVYGATSSDLIHWTPIVDAQGNLRAFISPRKGYFDSQLTECGPPAVLTKDGIVLLYNGKNAAGADGDPSVGVNAYSAGQVLFSATDPTQPLARLDKPFLRPEAPFEKSGQYVDGTVFVEGLVFFQKKWFLYYGCADSRVAVAVFDPATRP